MSDKKYVANQIVFSKLPYKKKQPSRLLFGGETGIRTLGPASWSTVFETAPIDHSGISPSVENGCKITNILPTGKIYFATNCV